MLPFSLYPARARFQFRGFRQQLVAMLIVPVAFALPACSPVGEEQGPGHRAQHLALSPQEELSLGRQAFKEILYKNSGRVLRQGPQYARVQGVGQRIVNAAMIRPLQREINLHFKPAYYEWEYAVLQEDQINAFCLPGGKICVFTGLLHVVENDDQLAAVLAHEVAHALAHHASERLARQQMLPAAAGMANGNVNTEPTARHGIIDMLSGLTGLAHDRAQESEADHIGLFLMTFAGYDPGQAVVFWERMQQVMGGRPRPPEILSDHPSDARRVTQMATWVPLARAAKKAYDAGYIAPETGH
jgi:metalloendopeptidase OMA1, mitochondrial